MCITPDAFEQRALYGPTGPMEWAGFVGEGTLEAYAYDKAVIERRGIPCDLPMLRFSRGQVAQESLPLRAGLSQ